MCKWNQISINFLLCTVVYPDRIRNHDSKSKINPSTLDGYTKISPSHHLTTSPPQLHLVTSSPPHHHHHHNFTSSPHHHIFILFPALASPSSASPQEWCLRWKAGVCRQHVLIVVFGRGRASYAVSSWPLSGLSGAGGTCTPPHSRTSCEW